MIHDFNGDLAFSLDNRDEPFWQAVFMKAFPTMVQSELCEDLALQRDGVDRIITLRNGATIKVDQKLRRKVYPDILIEYISIDRPVAKPGWIEKDLTIDYLAYAFLPNKRCYMYPWLLLKRAWGTFGEQWKIRYGVREAINNGYSTWSVPVPISELRDKISRAWIIQL